MGCVLTDAQIEALALVLVNDDRTAAGWPAVVSRSTIPDSEGYVRNVRALVAALPGLGLALEEVGPDVATGCADDLSPLGAALRTVAAQGGKA